MKESNLLWTQPTQFPAIGPLLATHNSHITIEKQNSGNDDNSCSICDWNSSKEDWRNCENLVIKTHRFPSAESSWLDSCILRSLCVKFRTKSWLSEESSDYLYTSQSGKRSIWDMCIVHLHLKPIVSVSSWTQLYKLYHSLHTLQSAWPCLFQ